MAAISAVFPLFAITFGIRARTYGVLLPLEAVILLLTIRMAWPSGAVTRRHWALLGLVAGVAVWHDVLLAVPLAICALLLLGRGSVLGWAQIRSGVPTATIAGLVGFSPWIAYNLLTRLGSLRHLYTPLSVYTVSTLTAARQVLARLRRHAPARRRAPAHGAGRDQPLRGRPRRRHAALDEELVGTHRGLARSAQ